jgi:hypothetical protein
LRRTGKSILVGTKERPSLRGARAHRANDEAILDQHLQTNSNMAAGMNVVMYERE